MAGKLSMLKDLARRAGRFLGGGRAAGPLPSGVVAADRFDDMAWREVAAAPALAVLAAELRERYDYVPDLLRDVFLAAYKAAPVLRGSAEVSPSRLPNRQILAGMMDSPELAELRRETAGDPYGAAMAVIAMSGRLREMLERARDAARKAQEQAAAREELDRAADQVQAAVEAAAAAADPGGAVPQDAAEAAEAAIAAALAAEAAHGQRTAEAAAAVAQAAPGLRSQARAALSGAIEDARASAALMAAWGVQPGTLQRMDVAARMRLAARLSGGRLGEFADLIGRFRMMAAGERARRVEHGQGEIIGITLGDDLSRLIPSELAALGVPAMRAVFAARLAEGRLMIYDTIGEMPAALGAIIALVDCSGSMSSPEAGGITREAWAKALALALLDQARAARPRRDFTGILFSDATTVRAFRFPASDPVSIEQLIEFAESFWGGGTDYEAPLTEAAEILAAEHAAQGRQEGDIVLITDSECEVSEDWMRGHQARKAQLGFRVFGVSVTAAVGPVLGALSDNSRTITDLADVDAAADLFRVI